MYVNSYTACIFIYIAYIRDILVCMYSFMCIHHVHTYKTRDVYRIRASSISYINAYTIQCIVTSRRTLWRHPIHWRHLVHCDVTPYIVTSLLVTCNAASVHCNLYLHQRQRVDCSCIVYNMWIRHSIPVWSFFESIQLFDGFGILTIIHKFEIHTVIRLILNSCNQLIDLQLKQWCHFAFVTSLLIWNSHNQGMLWLLFSNLLIEEYWTNASLIYIMMYSCTHACTCACKHVFYTCMYTCTYRAHMHTCMHKYMYVYVYTLYVHVFICTYVHKYVSLHLYVHIYIHVYISMYMYLIMSIPVYSVTRLYSDHTVQILIWSESVFVFVDYNKKKTMLDHNSVALL